MKILVKKYIVLILLLCSLVSLQLPFGSKKLYTHISELMLYVGGIYLLYMVCRKRGGFSPAGKLTLGVLIVYTLFHVFLMISRYSNGTLSATVLSLPRVAFTATLIYFLQDYGSIEWKDTVQSLLLFGFIVNVVQIVNCYIIGAVRTSYFMGNVMIYGTVVIALVPLQIAYLSSRDASKHLHAIVICSLGITISTALLAGSRIVTVLLPVSLILSMFIYRKSFTHIYKPILMAVVLAAVLIGGLLLRNVLEIRTAFFRGSGLDVSLGIDGDDLHTRYVDEMDAEIVEIDGIHYAMFSNGNLMEIEMDEDGRWVIRYRTSDLIRADLRKKSLKEFRKNPLFGTGVLTFDVQILDETFSQSAHNFIIELLTSSGLTGLALFVLLIGTPCVYPLIAGIRRKHIPKKVLGGYVSIAMIAAISMFQPSIWNPTVELTIWGIIAVGMHTTSIKA